MKNEVSTEVRFVYVLCMAFGILMLINVYPFTGFPSGFKMVFTIVGLIIAAPFAIFGIITGRDSLLSDGDYMGAKIVVNCLGENTFNFLNNGKARLGLGIGILMTMCIIPGYRISVLFNEEKIEAELIQGIIAIIFLFFNFLRVLNSYPWIITDAEEVKSLKEE